MTINLLQQRCRNLKPVQSCATRCGNECCIKNVACFLFDNIIINIYLYSAKIINKKKRLTIDQRNYRQYKKYIDMEKLQ